MTALLPVLFVLTVASGADPVDESRGMLAPADEPGEPMILEGRVVRESDGTLVLRTAPDGTFRARTIRPGAYSDDAGRPVPAHFHFTVTAEGFRPYAGEIFLGDDPETPSAGDEGALLGTTVAGDDGIPVCRASIPLQAVPH